MEYLDAPYFAMVPKLGQVSLLLERVAVNLAIGCVDGVQRQMNVTPKLQAGFLLDDDALS